MYFSANHFSNSASTVPVEDSCKPHGRVSAAAGPREGERQVRLPLAAQERPGGAALELGRAATQLHGLVVPRQQLQQLRRRRRDRELELRLLALELLEVALPRAHHGL